MHPGGEPCARSGRLAGRTVALGVPVVAVVGRNALGRDSLAEHGIERVWALSALGDRDTSADPRLSAQLLRQLGHRVGHDLGAPSLRA